ncbi:hypothetical protein [Labrenzia sp. DG1229]|uniref:hypothetical protein n=1 Tax=Labrenzia sp. DG1229 TaxID=681847 RepID=UPI0007C7B4B5|nr:hypothetical protein [Labrenzia sp. DG1229]
MTTDQIASDRTPDVIRLNPQAHLGVGSILGESSSILVQYFLPILAIVFVPDFLLYWASNELTIYIYDVEMDYTWLSGSGALVAVGLAFLMGFVVFFVETALLVQLAYDAKLKHPMQLGQYFKVLITNLLPVVLLGIVVLLLIIPAVLALIIGSWWVQAVFAVVVPAIVIERCGFGALKRSVELTRGFRWPIVGAMLLATIFSNFLDKVANAVSDLALEHGNALLESIAYAAISSIGYAFLGILTALIYARLREIKEGVSVDQIAEVFD